MFGILAGKRTYVVAGLGLLGVAAAFLMGDMAAIDAAKAAVECVLAMTIRAGIAAK